MKRGVVLACALALAVAVWPGQARADLSFGELQDGLEDFGEDLMDFLLEVLLSPAENLARMVLPVPLPEAPVGEHVMANPYSLDQSIDYATERVEDRYDRVEQLNAIAEMASEASTNNAAELEALEAANAAPPISVAAQQQLGNQGIIATAGAIQTLTQMVTAQTALEADRALQEEHNRQIVQLQGMQFVGYPEIAGGVQIVPGNAPMPW